MQPESELESGLLGSARQIPIAFLLSCSTTMRGVDEATGAAGEYPAVFVDFSLVGMATRFRAWMAADQRRKLCDGREITVYGDAVETMRARVVHVVPDYPEVEIELIDAA